MDTVILPVDRDIRVEEGSNPSPGQYAFILSANDRTLVHMMMLMPILQKGAL